MNSIHSNSSPIGVFDSGYGGLTILNELRTQLPEYDFIYLGDNARAPYGSRSFELVYEFTLEAVRYLFSQGCELVILACNTASAKALRTIQQRILPIEFPNKRVLGVIRPSAEKIDGITQTNHIGVLATEGTVKSESYVLEIQKLFPEIVVHQHACPIWVSLIENGKHDTEAGKVFIQEDVKLLLEKDSEIDTIILGCTHYPILESYLKTIVPPHIQLIAQGPIVAESLKLYLNRHPWLDEKCAKNGTTRFLTTENKLVFDQKASQIVGYSIESEQIHLG